MRFKAGVIITKPARNYGSGRMYTLTCNICGAKDSDNTSPGWYMDRPTQSDSHLWKVESGDQSCREILYSSLVAMSWYVDSVEYLRMFDMPLPSRTSTTPEMQVVEDLANGFWLGLTSSQNRFSYESNYVNMPAEFLDPKYASGGPMFSICGWFLKQGFNGIYGVNPDTHQSVAIDRTFAVSHTARLRELLASEDSLTVTRRKDILREVVKYLWVDLNHREASYSDLHNYCKYGVLWSALKGLDFLNPDHGFTYNGVGIGLVSALGRTKGSETYKRPDHYCTHVRSYSGSSYNGSHSFFRNYFNQHIDGRSVTRFCAGGSGMMKATAMRYLRYLPWNV